MTDDSEFQRARSPEQKEERRTLILETARALLIENPSERELSLNDLARRAKMAKSNLYRYFESREAIFLELLRLEWTAWLAEFEAELKLRFSACGPPRTRNEQLAALDSITRALTQGIAARPFLGRLAAILPTVLEHNLEPQTVRSFKLESVRFLKYVAALLRRTAPVLSESRYEELMHIGLSALVGAWSFGHPSETVRRVLEEPELACMRTEFERDFRRQLSLVARALLDEECA